MTTLKEIEAKANNTLYIKEIFELDSYLNGQDVNLLIRAVRQLGDIAEREDWPSYWTGSEWRSIDPDVLALLEEGR